MLYFELNNIDNKCDAQESGGVVILLSTSVCAENWSFPPKVELEANEQYKRRQAYVFVRDKVG